MKYDREKLQKLLVVFVVLIIILLVILMLYNNAPKNKSNIINSNLGTEQKENISTDITVDVLNASEKQQFVRDYTNITVEELEKIYKLFGYENVSINEYGFEVSSYYYPSYKLQYTDVWIDTNEIVKKIKKPDFGEIDRIVIGPSSIKISLIKVKEEDIEDYADDIKKEYDDKIEAIDYNTIYCGNNESGDRVEIKYIENKKEGYIEYSFIEQDV